MRNNVEQRQNWAGEKIRIVRMTRGWSQSKLATKLQLAGWKISRSKLAKIEAGLAPIWDFQLLYFSYVLGVHLDVITPNFDLEIAPEEPCGS